MKLPLPGNDASRPSLSLVFPAFDEEANLDELMAGACRVGEELAEHFEVVVVNDGSRDRSAEIINTWAESEGVKILQVNGTIATQSYNPTAKSGGSLQSNVGAASDVLITVLYEKD